MILVAYHPLYGSYFWNLNPKPWIHKSKPRNRKTCTFHSTSLSRLLGSPWWTLRYIVVASINGENRSSTLKNILILTMVTPKKVPLISGSSRFGAHALKL